MRGKSLDELKKEFEFLKADVEKLGYEVDINNCLRLDYGQNDDRKALWYLGWSIQQMEVVDEVWFLPGWNRADGCTLEHGICIRYNIPFKLWDGCNKPS
jgi:hypothetical protein